MTLLSASEADRRVPASGALSGVCNPGDLGRRQARTPGNGLPLNSWPRVVCAWCRDVISEGDPSRVSHGICLPCAAEVFPEYDQEV